MHEPKLNVLDRCNAMNKKAQLNMHECSSIAYFILSSKGNLLCTICCCIDI